MYFDNTVYSSRGGIIGFRCYECGLVKDRMWGDTCNECREKERRHKELIAAIEAAANTEEGGGDG